MSELIVMCGPAGSGKSTWAQEYAKSHNGYIIVSTDAIRQLVFGDANDQRNPKLIFDFAYNNIEEFLKDGCQDFNNNFELLIFFSLFIYYFSH